VLLTSRGHVVDVEESDAAPALVLLRSSANAGERRARTKIAGSACPVSFFIIQAAPYAHAASILHRFPEGASWHRMIALNSRTTAASATC
jgi:hypothetical protein